MSRIFDSTNCRNASVYDVDTVQKLERVMFVDIDRAELTIASEPLRAVGNEIATETVRFRSIHPIYGGRVSPQLFHCYGRIPG